MATITAIASGASLTTTANYITNKAEIVTGIDCPNDCDRAVEQMQITKELFGKTDGVEHYHYVQSFAESDNISPELANEIGQQIAKELFPGYEGIIATHTDTKKIHNHFDFNSVNWETGLKLQIGPPELQKMKDLSDKICLEHGLSVVDQTQTPIGTFKSYDKKEWKARENSKERGIPFTKDVVYDDVVECLEKSTNKVDFVNNMYAKGYKTEWSEAVKNITFTDSEGKSYRAGTLGKNYSDPRLTTKENLLSELENNRKNIKPPVIKMTAEQLHKAAVKKIRGLESIKNPTKEDCQQLKEARIIKDIIFKRYDKERHKGPTYAIRHPSSGATNSTPTPFDAAKIFADALMGNPGVTGCVALNTGTSDNWDDLDDEEKEKKIEDGQIL